MRSVCLSSWPASMQGRGCDWAGALLAWDVPGSFSRPADSGPHEHVTVAWTWGWECRLPPFLIWIASISWFLPFACILEGSRWRPWASTDLPSMGWQHGDAQAGLAVHEGGVYGTYGTGLRP